MFGGEHKIKRLQDIPLLSECPAPDLRAIASRGEIVAVRKGDVVRPMGRERSLVVLLEGAAACEDGTVLEAGDSYGSAELLRDKRRAAEVRMLTDGQVLVVGARAFTGLIYTVPSFALAVRKDVAARAS